MEGSINNRTNKLLNNKKGSLSSKNSSLLCNWCPFLSLKDSDLQVHINLVHELKKPSHVYELLCPACPNIFHHKLSLQAHLNYDHGVTNNEDVAKIIQIALHTKKSKVFTRSNGLITKDDATNATNDTNKLEEALPKTVEIAEVENVSENTSNESQEEAFQLKSVEVTITKRNCIEKPSNFNADANLKKEIAPSAKEQNEIPKQNPFSKFLNENKVNKCFVEGCKVKMEDLKKLKYHAKCHVDNAFVCPECKEAFAAYKSLAGHLWRNHEIDMELFKCDQCDYRTHSLCKLNNTHKLIHKSERNFICDLCSKSFKNMKQLRNHKYTHKGVVVIHKCNDCQKDFNNKSQLRVHINSIHKKLKPFVCQYCDFKAATNSALKIHTRMHTGEKPFCCEFCDYTCSDHNSLRRHTMRHTGQKPYKCSHCDYECIQTSTFKVHIKTKHPGLDKEIVFSCPSCQFRSINKDVYNAHLYSQHPVVMKMPEKLSAP